MDLPWRHSLMISGAYSETDGIVAQPFSLEGQSYQIGLNYTIPFAEAGELTHNLSFSLDFKSSDNNFDFSDIPISDNLTEVVQVRATYSGTRPDPSGTTSFSIALTAAPGNVTSRNKDEFFSQSRSSASADYLYGNMTMRRQTNLPGLLTGWTWNVRARAQFSSDNLIGSEQFGAGGVGSVRGYEEGEVYGDEGVLISHELVAPSFPLANKLRASLNDSLSLYVFQDYARTRSVKKLPGESKPQLHSLGLGFRYQLAQMVSAQAAWGVQLKDSGSSDSGDNHRLHLNLRFSF